MFKDKTKTQYQNYKFKEYKKFKYYVYVWNNKGCVIETMRAAS